MDYIKYDLWDILQGSNKAEIQEDHMIKIIYKLLCALKFLHESNIIHRDIKPENILADASGNLRICDFGLARSLP